MPAETVLLICCAVAYGAVAVTIVVRAVRKRLLAMQTLLMAAVCVTTVGWAVAGLVSPGATGIGGGADLLRGLAWFGFLFFLYYDTRLGRPLHLLGFALAGAIAAGLGVLAMNGLLDAFMPPGGLPPVVVARLTLAVAALLLIENLYLNLPQEARWHVALPSLLMGGVACFDLLLCADLVLFHAPTPALEGARSLGMLMIAPLLAAAAARGQRRGRVRLSREAAFHSATLVLCGSVLLALGLAGEVFRNFSGAWGWLAETSLAIASAIGIGLMLTSGSARSRFQRLFVDHFFAERYDYRRQWQACIRTLSGEVDATQWSAEPDTGLAARAIRTVVTVVDSPAGILFLREPNAASGAFQWAGSWNMRATEAVPDMHPLVQAMRGGAWVARLDGPHQVALTGPPLDALGPLWLAVPLVHRGTMLGFVLAGPPRAPFDLEQEVFDLLRIVAKEVATYIAEQRATQTLLQTRALHDYGKRFAFVAHDIKNVSSQLALLLSNAESHISNPAFQKDMLDTVRASVRKITALLQRLEQPEPDSAPGSLAPLPRIEALVTTYRRVRRSQISVTHDGSTGSVAMGADAFETAVTHLLNNAVEASYGRAVVVRVRHETRQVVIEIVDQGPGMTADFVREELFEPFSTSKPGGTGIGAFQSRELLRAAGGDLVVISAPGAGTTVRLLLPRTDALGPPVRALTETTA